MKTHPNTHLYLNEDNVTAEGFTASEIKSADRDSQLLKERKCSEIKACS